MSTRKLAENHAQFVNILPERKHDRTRVLKEQSQVLAQTEGMGAPSIKKKLDAQYGETKVPSERTISGWIAGSREHLIESPEWSPWAADQTLTDDIGHLLRLDQIKKSNLFHSLIHKVTPPPNPPRALTVKEADTAVKLQLSLHGLDLFIQMVIVQEYAHRLAFTNPSTGDLDLLVATQPWVDGRLYRDLLRQGNAYPVEIATLVRHSSFEGVDPRILVQFWAWNELNVPWTEVAEIRSPETGETTVTRFGYREPPGGTPSRIDADAKLFNWNWQAVIGIGMQGEFSDYMDKWVWPDAKNSETEEIDEAD